jgi:hypothetical protein
VLADGQVVGRILEEGSRFGPPELRWRWSITAIVPASPATHGHPGDARRSQGPISRQLDKAKTG